MRDRDARKRQGIAFALIILFGIVMLYAVFGSFVGEVEKSTGTVVHQEGLAGNPSFSALVTSTFRATGSLSAGNDINVQVTVSNVSIPNLLRYYCCLGYIIATTGGAGNQIPLKQVGDNYVGSGTLRFDTASDIYWWFVPQSYTYVPLGSLTNKSLVIQIGDISQTLAWHYGEQATRLGWIVVAFSILLLQPLLEAVWKLER